MAVHSVVGFGMRAGLSETAISAEAFEYWLVSIPVVVIGAPLGAKFIANQTREFICLLLLSSFVIQFTCALMVIEQSTPLLLFSSATLAAGTLFFSWMAKARRHVPEAHSKVET